MTIHLDHAAVRPIFEREHPMKRRMSDDKIIDTVIAMDVALSAFFVTMREQQPEIARSLREQLLAASKVPIPGLGQATVHVRDYADLLATPPTPAGAH